MNIPAEAKQKWESLWQQGDITDISKESKLSYPTIAAAINGSECSEEVFTAIQTFYNKRQESINNLVNPQDRAQA